MGVSKADEGSVGFEVAVAEGFCGLAEEACGFSCAVPVGGGVEFAGEFAAGDDEFDVEDLWALVVGFLPVVDVSGGAAGFGAGFEGDDVEGDGFVAVEGCEEGVEFAVAEGLEGFFAFAESAHEAADGFVADLEVFDVVVDGAEIADAAGVGLCVGGLEGEECEAIGGPVG